MTDGLMLPPGAGRSLAGAGMTLKVGADQSNAWSAFEALVTPGFDVGPPAPPGRGVLLRPRRRTGPARVRAPQQGHRRLANLGVGQRYPGSARRAGVRDVRPGRLPARLRQPRDRPGTHAVPVPHQNVGVFCRVRITGGELRPEPNGDIAESVWTPICDVAQLRRSSLVDVGLALARTVPATGHVAPVAVGGLIQHQEPRHDPKASCSGTRARLR